MNPISDKCNFRFKYVGGRGGGGGDLWKVVGDATRAEHFFGFEVPVKTRINICFIINLPMNYGVTGKVSRHDVIQN